MDLGLCDSRTLLEYGSFLRQIGDFEGASKVLSKLFGNLNHRKSTRFNMTAGEKREMGRFSKLSLRTYQFPSVETHESKIGGVGS